MPGIVFLPAQRGVLFADVRASGRAQRRRAQTAALFAFTRVFRIAISLYRRAKIPPRGAASRRSLIKAREKKYPARRERVQKRVWWKGSVVERKKKKRKEKERGSAMLARAHLRTGETRPRAADWRARARKSSLLIDYAYGRVRRVCARKQSPPHKVEHRSR